MSVRMSSISSVFGFLLVSGTCFAAWDAGEPVVTYWGGPGFFCHPEKLTDRAAKQLSEGGFNVVWASSVAEMDIAAKYGLRVIFYPKMEETDVRDPKAAAALAARIDEVRNHPALYIYYHIDEPPAGKFVELARTKEWLAKRDPKHPAWINLLPTYAKNYQLGVEGEILAHGGVDFAPYAEPVALNGAKWVLGKAASVKFATAKGSTDKTKVLQGYDDPKKPNVSGLKLGYTAKTGAFKGSFKVYALQGAAGREKLRKYTVNVTGIVVDGRGFGIATCKKPQVGPFSFEVR